MDRTLNLLKKMVSCIGGQVIVTSGHVVGYRDTDNQFCKLFVKGDFIFLEQVSGPERGLKAEIATLSDLLSREAEAIS